VQMGDPVAVCERLSLVTAPVIGSYYVALQMLTVLDKKKLIGLERDQPPGGDCEPCYPYTAGR
jgi:hypothetical protein